MKRSTWRIGLLAAGALWWAPDARAQETMTFHVVYDSAVIGPGQVQGVSVWATLNPGIGQLATWNTPPGTGQLLVVSSFADARFDLRNVAGGETGTFSGLSVNPAFGTQSGNPGTPDGLGNVLGIYAVQFGPVYSANPSLLWNATWAPNTYEPRTVTFDTMTLVPPRVWLELNLGHALDEWVAVNVPSSFEVVPAPATFGLLALAGLRCARRRR